MNFNDGTTKLDLDKSTTTVDASHESGDTQDVEKTEDQKLDGSAMDSAKRSQNRIHQSEQENPEDTLFTK